MSRVRLVLIGAATVALGLASGADARAQTITISGDTVQSGVQSGIVTGPVREFKKGTGRVRGRVLSAETGAPLRRVQVRLTGTDTPFKSVMTDVDGVFTFTELPVGRFTITASKAGFVDAQYGQTRPLEQGKPIELIEGGALDKADLLMARGSAITGRIVDELGEPVADAFITALHQQWSNGHRRLVPSGRTAQTNDLGQYRLFGLPPGEYYISATVRNFESSGMEFAALTGQPTALQTQAPASGYAATYYPGTAAPADAQRVSVALGQEAQNTDFAMLATRLARVTGVVVNSEGRPVEGAMVSAVPQRLGEGPMMAGGGARTARDGSFTLSGVAPGEYLVQVRSLTVITSGGGNGMFTVSARVGGPDGESEVGLLPLTIAGEDISGVVITTTKGVTASGRVTFDGQRPQNTGGLRIMALPIVTDGPAMFVGGPGAAIAEDSTFQLTGQVGPRYIRVMGLPPGYSLKSVEVNGIDVTDTGIDFRNENVTGIDVVVSSRSTDVSGTATSADGSAAKDFTVVVFAQDQDKWTLPGGRWITGARPDQDGRFHLRNLPAGSYFAVAVDYLAQGEWNDPDVLDRLKRAAESITLVDGDTKVLTLPLRTAR